MLQIFSLALLGDATTSSHQIFPSTCDIVPKCAALAQRERQFFFEATRANLDALGYDERRS